MACATMTCGRVPARSDAPRRRDDRLDRPFPPRYRLRIAPRRFDLEPTLPDAVEIPRGAEPARAGRPLLAFLAVLVFAVGVYVQVDRYQDCRSDGGDTLTCLVSP